MSDLVLPAPSRTTFQSVIASLFLSLAGAGLVAALLPPDYLAHLFSNAPLSVTTLRGIAVHSLACVAVALGYTQLVRRVFKHRLSRQRSAYPTAWDALWSPHGSESRRVGIELANGRYFEGILAHADDPRIGHDLLIREPREWDAQRQTYVSINAEFTYVPADQVRRVDVSRATQPTTGAQHDEQGQRQAEPGRRDEGGQDGGRHVQQEHANHLPRAEGSGRQHAGQHDQPDADAEPRVVARARD